MRIVLSPQKPISPALFFPKLEHVSFSMLLSPGGIASDYSREGRPPRLFREGGKETPLGQRVKREKGKREREEAFYVMTKATAFKGHHYIYSSTYILLGRTQK